MKIKNIIAVQFVIVAFATAFMTSSHAQDAAAPTEPDIGFSHAIHHYPIGSKNVLVFQSNSLVVGKARFGVASDFVDDNIEVLNKFLKWAELAQQRGDILTKEIGLVKGLDFGVYYYWNRYEFQTNQTAAGVSYILCVQPGTKLLGISFTPQGVDETTQAGGPIDFKMYFNQEQVKQIIQRLQVFKQGKLQSVDEAAYK